MTVDTSGTHDDASVAVNGIALPHSHTNRVAAAFIDSLMTPAQHFGHSMEELDDLARTRFHGGDYIVAPETLAAAKVPCRNASRVVIRNPFGELKQLVFGHNVRTNDGGYVYMQGIGGGANFVASRTATGVTATTLTDTGATFPASTGSQHGTGLVGCFVQMGGVFGVVISNTATVLTIDQWYNPTSSTGAAAATPTAGEYLVLPGQAPARWIALSSDTASESSSDTTLASEITTAFNSTTPPRWLGAYTVTTAPSGSGTSNTTAIDKLDSGSQTCNDVSGSTVNKLGVTQYQNGGYFTFTHKLATAATCAQNDTLDASASITNS